MIQTEQLNGQGICEVCRWFVVCGLWFVVCGLFDQTDVKIQL